MWGFATEFRKFRPNVITKTELEFWEDETDELPQDLNNVRILVCGNNGVGKSTLINRVFGISAERTQDHVVSLPKHYK